MRRGLVQRQACSDHRCDDGIRLDTGGECENCGNVVHIRRARRAKIAAQIDRELPGLSAGERRRVLEERLREQVAIEGRTSCGGGSGPARSRPAARRPVRLPRNGRSSSARPGGRRRGAPGPAVRRLRASAVGRPVRGVRFPAPDRGGDRKEKPEAAHRHGRTPRRPRAARARQRDQHDDDRARHGRPGRRRQRPRAVRRHPRRVAPELRRARPGRGIRRGHRPPGRRPRRPRVRHEAALWSSTCTPTLRDAGHIPIHKRLPTFRDWKECGTRWGPRGQVSRQLDKDSA